MAKLSGIGGFVQISGAVLEFTTWELEIETNDVNTNTFTDGGFQTNVAGVTKGEMTLEAKAFTQAGVFSIGNNGGTLTAPGTTTTFTLGLSPTLSINIPIRVKTCNIKADYDGAVSIKVSGPSNGAFTFTLA